MNLVWFGVQTLLNLELDPLNVFNMVQSEVQEILGTGPMVQFEVQRISKRTRLNQTTASLVLGHVLIELWVSACPFIVYRLYTCLFIVYPISVFCCCSLYCCSFVATSLLSSLSYCYFLVICCHFFIFCHCFVIACCHLAL